jgi:hypothetical protein
MEITKLEYLPDLADIDLLKSKFRFWHIETLVNQSAQLVEDCLNDLKEIYSLKNQSFIYNQEKNEITKNIEIEERFLMKFTGDDDIPNAIDEKSFSIQLETEKSIRDLNNSENSAYPYNANQYIIEDPRQGDGMKQSNNPNYYHLQNRLNRNNLEIQKLDAELKILYKSERDKKDIKEKERKQKIIEINKEKLKIRGENEYYSSIFNYELFIQLANERLERNYKDLVERIFVIEEGLEKIYDIKPTIQYELNKKVSSGKTQKYTFEEIIEDPLLAGQEKMIYFNLSPLQKINDIYLWLYDKIKYLASYSQLDQSFTSCYSLKELFTVDIFEKLKNSEKSFEAEFKIPVESFPNLTHENIRFRGIGAFIIGSAGKFPWKINIKFPKNAFYLRDAKENFVDQSEIPNCILGRVENINSQRNIEYCGLNSLINISPLTYENYSITIEKPNVDYEQFGDILDIILEINLTGKLL